MKASLSQAANINVFITDELTLRLIICCFTVHSFWILAWGNAKCTCVFIFFSSSTSLLLSASPFTRTETGVSILSERALQVRQVCDLHQSQPACAGLHHIPACRTAQPACCTLVFFKENHRVAQMPKRESCSLQTGSAPGENIHPGSVQCCTNTGCPASEIYLLFMFLLLFCLFCVPAPSMQFWFVVFS